MIDFHSHILPQIDDGSKSFEETIRMLEEARDVGFQKIISTSHYMEKYYEVDEEQRFQLIKQINFQDIELYLGSEIYVTNEIVQLLKDKKASTINNSRYVLYELPMHSKNMNDKEIIYRLVENGYVPIIAHPERYSYVQEDTEYVDELAEMGALFQSNYGSIIGMYGEKAKKTVKKLLKQNLIHFLGSDVHRAEQIYPKIPKIMKKLSKIVSQEKLEELTTLNAQKVLNDEEIDN